MRAVTPRLLLAAGFLVGLTFSAYPQGQPLAQGNASAAPASPELSAKAKKASDAAKAVEDAVASAKQLAALANKYQKSITDITGADTKSKTPPPENLQAIQATVQAILQQGQGGLLTGLATIRKALDSTSNGSAEANRSSLCKALDDAAASSNSTQQDAQDAHTACVQAGQDAADQGTALGTALSGLQSAVQGIYSYFRNQANALGNEDNFKSVSQLAVNEAKPDAGTLIHVLQKGLLALKNEIESERQYKSTWDATRPLVQTLLKDAPPGDTPKTGPADVDKAFSDLDATVDGVKPKLSTWFATIEADLTSSATSLDSTLAPVLSDPAKNSAAALGSVRDLTDKIASVQPVLDAWPPLIGYLEDGKPASFNLQSTRKAAESLQTAQNVLRGAVARMHDALAGDMSQFETASVSLYYFTDVPRLMRALNENVQTIGGVAEAQANAAAQRKALTETELELADAQATVNRHQKEVLDLQEQQRQLQAKLKSQDSQVSKLASRLKGAQDGKNQSDADYQNAQAAQQQSPSDPTLAGDLRAASAKQTAAATKLSQTQSDYNNAVTQRDATLGGLHLCR